ncbi:type II and III secretion system protein family protein [Paraherbaspirillum soli]|uniref:Type II and III secretion system protein family protein n=1 Tax=Paraherbaspirillum soli TaxID=631222 RepID=A0ABW0MEF2_9BURK
MNNNKICEMKMVGGASWTRIGKSLLMATAGLAMALTTAIQAQPAMESTAPMSALPLPAIAAPGTAATAAAAPARRGVTPTCIGEFAPSANVNLPEGKSGQLDLQQLHLPAPAWLRTIGNPEVVQVEPLTSPTPRTTFFLFGKKVGSTNLMFQNREGRCAMVEVSVGIDTASVQSKINQLMPEEKNIKVGAASDSLVLSGVVADTMAVDRALAIANAYVRKGSGGAGGSGGERIVNMLLVSAPQQVMLEVKVAEISKTLLDQLGANFSAILHRGKWATSLASNFLTGANGVLNVTKSTPGDSLTIDAEKKDGFVKILAEPNIMAISGQEGSFLAGGRIFIPVPQSSASGIATITLEEKEFGVGLRFTPTVLDGGRINLKVAPEVSELSGQGASISGIGTAASIIPLITTRRASTTVQLFDGQSFAIGGLIKNNVTQNVSAFPILGEIPVLGALFRSRSFQTDKTELVFIITPRLVKPLPPDYPLPTDGFIEPSRAEFFLEGKMEGAAPAAKPAPAPAAAMPMPAAETVPPSGFELK